MNDVLKVEYDWGFHSYHDALSTVCISVAMYTGCKEELIYGILFLALLLLNMVSL